MAAGTPVIAYTRGSMPEIVDEGVTGFLVRRRRQAAAAVESAIAELDRANVRRVGRARVSARTAWSTTTLLCMTRSSA